ncbi:MAG: hypothetical protein K0B06_07885 [Brevefilum sp.]|nr:hypothetical protein [Brevefilum sp.]
MTRLISNRTIFLWLSISLAVIGVGLIVLLMLQYGPRKPQASVPEDALARFQPTHTRAATPTPQPEPTSINPTQTVEPSPTPTFTPSPTPTPEWMTYDGIDFRNQEIETLISMNCEGDQVYLNPFRIRPYTPELFESGAFYYNLAFSMAWEHLGFYGLWIHSGQSPDFGDLPAYPLQLYLENDESGYRRSPSDFNAHLQSCLFGSELRLRQGDNLSLSEVVAAVRIPAVEVDEVSRHPMDLVPFLAENYPDSGFDRMETPGLLFYFCGRQLSGEAYHNNHDYWTQSRIIIGFIPISEN